MHPTLNYRCIPERIPPDSLERDCTACRCERPPRAIPPESPLLLSRKLPVRIVFSGGLPRRDGEMLAKITSTKQKWDGNRDIVLYGVHPQEHAGLLCYKPPILNRIDPACDSGLALTTPLQMPSRLPSWWLRHKVPSNGSRNNTVGFTSVAVACPRVYAGVGFGVWRKGHHGGEGGHSCFP